MGSLAHARQHIHQLILALEEVLSGPPDVRQMEDAPFLNLWAPVRVRSDISLFGQVSGHPSLPERQVITSLILYIDLERRISRTMNRWYRLGEPRDYLREAADAFPNIDMTDAVLNIGNDTVGATVDQLHAAIADFPRSLLADCLLLQQFDLLPRLDRVVKAWPV